MRFVVMPLICIPFSGVACGTRRPSARAFGKAYTAIDTRDDSVYRYGYGAQHTSSAGLLDAEEGARVAA